MFSHFGLGPTENPLYLASGQGPSHLSLKRHTTCVALLLSRCTVSQFSPYGFAVSHENLATPLKVSQRRPCRTCWGGGSHLNFALYRS